MMGEAVMEIDHAINSLCRAQYALESAESLKTGQKGQNPAA